MQEKILHETTAKWTAGLNAYGLTKSMIREIFATFLLLRMVDRAENMEVFEDRSPLSQLPDALQWHHWSQLSVPHQISERLSSLARHLGSLHRDSAYPESIWLPVLAEPLQRILEVNFVYLQDLVHWIDKLPLEMSSDGSTLLVVFDTVLDETGDAYEGQFSSPATIARLVAAVANPQPGEQVYDPCFGFGNFLTAAWKHARRSSNDLHHTGPMLEIAGTEINSSVFLIGLTRTLLAGVDTPHLELGNSLDRGPDSSSLYDVVMANPPIGAKTSRDAWRYREFAFRTSDSLGLFIQHALAQLKPNGRAVIAVPEGFLFRGGAERELRRYLVERGQVEAVIGLPAGAYAPYTNVKSCLLVLSKQGGLNRVRMVDAAPLFEQRSGRKAPIIRTALAQYLANEIRRPELRKPLKPAQVNSEDKIGTGVFSRSVWELSKEELAAVEWDLSPRRREKGGFTDLLSALNGELSAPWPIIPLSTMAQISAGRSIKSVDLVNEPPRERSVGYIRIKDLIQGKVARCSSWLAPGIVEMEQRSALLPGDVLVSKSGTIGKTALVRKNAAGSIAANGLYVLRADQTQLNPGFLLAYLASPPCQNWLAAQTRGTVIQHINRAVLDELPILLPPLQLQASAAAQFRDFGIDAMSFLTQAVGIGESGRLTTWLAELISKIPNFTVALDATPALSQFDVLTLMAKRASGWVEQDQIAIQSAGWLLPLIETLLQLVDVGQIPPGPGLLTVLQEVERGFQNVLEHTTGHLPTESQARAVVERLSDWIRAAITDLFDSCGIRVRSAPPSLTMGGFAEFEVELSNDGVLPLRRVRFETSPDWGSTDSPYLTEHGVFALNLRGEVPEEGDHITLLINWSAQNLIGQTVSGVIELPVQIAQPEQHAVTVSEALGGSPYVTGSPLEPQHGHDVFFGRDEVLRQIAHQVATHGNVVLLEGNRRTGKTSILKHLEGSSVIPGWLAVYSSLQGAEGAAHAVGVPTAEVFREVSRCIAMALSRLKVDVPLPNGHVIEAGKHALGIARACREGIGNESPFVDFREYLELTLSVLESLGLGLVLMLDEFDKLQEGIDNGVTSPQVPENIRFLIQSYPNFSAILTGSRRLKRLREEYWSALYGLGTSIPVTALDVHSARNVVTEPVRDKLIYSNEAIERIVDLTARHPYLMQCLCNKVFSYAVQTNHRSITLSVVNDAASSLVRDNEHFASLWDYAGLGPNSGRRRRQLILFLCALSFKQGTHISFGTLHEQLMQAGLDVDDEALDTDLAYLRELELIDLSGEIGDGHHYGLSIPLMADWIEQQQDADVVVSRARTESEEENA